MTDWMNELEAELHSLQPKPASRDLVTAAMVAHRDSEVLRAVRLRNELTADQLESVLLVLAASHPELLAASPEESSSVALAFVRTPMLDSQPAKPQPATPASRAGAWVRGSVMAAALLLCFLGGMATGLRPGAGDEELVAGTEKAGPATTTDVASPELVSNANEKSGEVLVLKPRQPVIQIEPSRQFDPNLRRAVFGRHGRSSLTDMNAAYQQRLKASRMQASL